MYVAYPSFYSNCSNMLKFAKPSVEAAYNNYRATARAPKIYYTENASE